jgi:hypothetical protein
MCVCVCVCVCLVQRSDIEMGLIHDIVTLVTEPLFTGLSNAFGCQALDTPDVVVYVLRARKSRAPGALLGGPDAAAAAAWLVAWLVFVVPRCDFISYGCHDFASHVGASLIINAPDAMAPVNMVRTLHVQGRGVQASAVPWGAFAPLVCAVMSMYFRWASLTLLRNSRYTQPYGAYYGTPSKAC